MTSSPFEGKIVKILNGHYVKNGIRAEAHRIKQSRYGGQKIDVISDSKNRKYYLGIECKSVNGEENNNLYFTQHFTTDRGGEHQVLRLSRYIYNSGRLGILAVEIRTEGQKHNRVYFVPFGDVIERYKAHEKGLPFEWIEEYPRLSAGKRGWNVEAVLEDVCGRYYEKHGWSKGGSGWYRISTEGESDGNTSQL